MNAVVETQLNFPQYSPLGKRIANGEAVYSDTFIGSMLMELLE